MKSGKHHYGAAVYVGSFLKATILCFLLANCDGINKLMQRFYWSKCWECNVGHLQVHKNI